ncbi:hypothetical protein PF005_g11247 [Phytophthora fragariae]|uniref:Uncharacterized protein n=1 Tax=Phytophthora fragariae TaxID=53985 RepID=A0A6A3U872_9STRA|nr:hypothetical protein PF003_g4005 [Phytophthora fragariae]KAE8937598.1 hypothetical protein PF009_g12495 [Phytophthora fragariae]KAE9009421.1 hypothetical protein PF011_g10271 [Phytophthora fragariae]KAE9111095.1 hypothetical protein PF007_g11607 [Phytophthora fragariae]KAE9111512.1 hypothetical protein PF010_g10774 [Phytophthora fragariae]
MARIHVTFSFWRRLCFVMSSLSSRTSCWFFFSWLRVSRMPRCYKCLMMQHKPLVY